MPNFKFQVSKAFLLYNKLFQNHHKLAPCALKWHETTELFHPNFPRNQTLKYNSIHLWYFNVFVVIGVIGFGSCLHVILNAQSNDVSKPLVVMSFGFATMSVLCWAAAYVIARHVDNIVSGFKAMYQVYDRLGKL